MKDIQGMKGSLVIQGTQGTHGTQWTYSTQGKQVI